MPPGKHAYLWWLGLAATFASVTGLLLLVLPSPHRPIHYLIAGTAGTAALLVVMFIILSRGTSTDG